MRPPYEAAIVVVAASWPGQPTAVDAAEQGARAVIVNHALAPARAFATTAST